MKKSDINQIIDRMVEAVGAKNQSEMLELAGFSSSAAASWKKRGAVSDKSLVKISQLSGASIAWLKTGERTFEKPQEDKGLGPISDSERRVILALRKLPEVNRKVHYDNIMEDLFLNLENETR